MNKAQLIETLSAHYDGSKTEAAKALNTVVQTITYQTAKGEKVTITGFGVFEKVKRSARMVRNPRTGERKRAKATAVPKFRAGSDLKAFVSGERKVPKAATKKAAPAVTAPAATKKATPATKATPARKTAAAKKAPATKVTPVKTHAAKKAPATKVTAAKKTVAPKAPATKGAAKKSPAKKTVATKAPAKKTAAKKAPATKAAAKKSTGRRSAAAR